MEAQNKKQRTIIKEYKPFLIAEVFYNTNKRTRELNL